MMIPEAIFSPSPGSALIVSRRKFEVIVETARAVWG